MIESIQASLAAFGVGEFDVWSYESALHQGDPSPVAHTLAILEQQGHTYRSEGALWLRTTDFGDDKDRVLVRSSGEHTYFASDIAYHQDKRERGFERQIDVWGADHHGYVLRMKAAYEALGGDPAELELLIMQLVHLMSFGERAQMSKRAGEFVSLDDLVAEIGVDAARWYLLARSHDTTVDLDLDLASEQSSENDVYYVQYAHARIASMLRAGGPRARAGGERGDGAARARAAARDRARAGGAAAGVPGGLAEAAQRRAPHRIASYALALAQTFTAFYRDCHVVGAEPEAVESFRIALCVLSRRTIARCLGLLGVKSSRAGEDVARRGCARGPGSPSRGPGSAELRSQSNRARSDSSLAMSPGSRAAAELVAAPCARARRRQLGISSSRVASSPSTTASGTR